MGRAVTYAIGRAGSLAVQAQTEAHHRSVIDSLGEGVVVLSASGEVETANAEAARILGLTVDELYAPAPTEFRWSAVDERDRPLPNEPLPAMVALRTGEPVVDFTMGVQPPVGGLRWRDVNAFPMKHSPDAPPYAVVVSMRDITETRAALKRTQFHGDLLDAVGQAVMATDATGAITYWNHAAEQQCGWPAHEALGRNLVKLTSPEMAKRMEPILADLIAGRSWTGDLDVLRRDGTRFPALVTDTPYFDGEGKLAGVIVVTTDITERDRAEETVRRLSAMNRAATRSWARHSTASSPAGIAVPRPFTDTELMRSSITTFRCSYPTCPPTSSPMCSAASRSVRPSNTSRPPAGAKTE